jgi:hypothetical protein
VGSEMCIRDRSWLQTPFDGFDLGPSDRLDRYGF